MLANRVDDPYNKVQLLTELGIDFFIKGLSSCAKVSIEFFRVFQDILREFELDIQRQGQVNFRERRPHWVVLTEAS